MAATRSDDKERFVVTDLAQSYIRQIQGRKSYKTVQYSLIKSWFRSHRRKLPDDYDRDFIRQLKSERPSVSSKLTMDVLRDALTVVRNDPRRRSMVLTQFQTFSGVKELTLINENYGHYLGEKIKAGEVPIELEMKWQRKSHGESWFTYIGKAAAEALKEYFERERGYPTPGEPIWYEVKSPKSKIPMTRKAYQQMWARLVALLGYRPPLPREAAGKAGPWTRYGLGTHKIRTLAISQSQSAIGKTLNLDGRPFNPESAEYFAGHEVDELGYRQLHGLDPNYRREQYMIVEPYLDPYGKREFTAQQEEEIETLKQQMAEIRQAFTATIQRLNEQDKAPAKLDEAGKK
jgi:hypothetical protein